ncbi:MAG: hypothetical protein ACO24O_04405 [Arenimonas sp.]
MREKKPADNHLPTGGQNEGEQTMRLLELCQVITDAEAAGLLDLAARWRSVATGGQALTLEAVQIAENEYQAAIAAA